jgi:hypothetical protein
MTNELIWKVLEQIIDLRLAKIDLHDAFTGAMHTTGSTACLP